MGVDFRQWVEALFGADIAGTGYLPMSNISLPSISSRQQVGFMTELFQSGSELSRRFSDAQLAHGFRLIRGPIPEPPPAYALHDQNVPAEERVACISAVEDIYASLVSSRCRREHAYAGPHAPAIDRVFSEWWTGFPLVVVPGDPGRAAIEQQCLRSLAAILKLKSPVCQESALLGLGRWRTSHQHEVTSIINEYLRANAQTDGALRSLAQTMSEGESPWSAETFEDWVASVFGHEVRRPQWWFDASAEYHEPPSATTAAWLEHLFSNSNELLDGYSDGQLGQGFWFLLDPASSNHATALLDASVSDEQRRSVVQSVPNLFRDLFAQRCTPHLSHIDEEGAGALNESCYMWWDIAPWAASGDRHLGYESIRAMEEILEIESIACQESALHGLGHSHRCDPRRVEAIIDRFTESRGNARAELREYATAARVGRVQ